MIDYRDTCWFNVQGDMICVPTLHAYLPNTQKNDEFDLDLHQTNPSHLDLDLHHLHPSSLLPQPPWPATPLKSTPCWVWMGKPRQWSLHVRVGGRWEMTTMFACGWWFWFCHSYEIQAYRYTWAWWAIYGYSTSLRKMSFLFKCRFSNFDIDMIF